jgi:hypothetical protein
MVPEKLPFERFSAMLSAFSKRPWPWAMKFVGEEFVGEEREFIGS